MTQVSPEITDEDELEAPEGNDLKMLRRKARLADKLETEVEEGNRAKRELAFVKAGIDTDSPLGVLFFNGYDGDLTKEAITTAFAALGGPTADGDGGTDDEFTDEERASTRERQNLASGATGDTGEAPATPVRGKDGAAARAGRDVRDAGGTAEDALGASISTLIGAGMSGDRSVIIPNGPVE